MTTAPFEPSGTDPNLRPDTAPDGTPTPAPGLDVHEPDNVPGQQGDPSEPSSEES